MEFLDTLFGVVVAYLGYRVGVSREKSLKRPPKKVEAYCGCHHHRSFHKDGTGRCEHLDHWKIRDCGCQKYMGPMTYNEIMADEEIV